MRFTNKAREYLSECIDANKSEILLADLDKIIFSANLFGEKEYLNRNISHEIKGLIALWKKQGPNAELLISEPSECIDIITNDSYKYTSQIFLPIYQANQLVGVFMHFTNNRIYIWSNLRNAKTLRDFTELLIAEEFIKK